MSYQSGHRSLAVIDIGSNSVRMVIYDIDHHPPEKIFNEKVFCALGRDLGTTGRLNPQATESAFKALRAYKLLSEVYHVADLRVVGTAALRDAADGPIFINQVRDEIGLDIRTIRGDEEAGYAARGVLVLDEKADGIVADFGGGSLEFARIHDNQVFERVSLPLGAYRIMALGDRDGAESAILNALEPLTGVFGQACALYAIGGSWRVLAMAYMKQTGQSAPLQGYTVSTPAMVQFCRSIMNLDEQELRQAYRMESHHARQAGTAAFALSIVLQKLAPAAFVVSTAGVRDGVAHEFLLSDTKTR